MSARALRQLTPISRIATARQFTALAGRRLLSVNSSISRVSLVATKTSICTPRRSYSVLSEEPEAVLYDYKNVKDLASNPSAHPNTVLVDVREPCEFQEGHIPSAINIPFKTSPGALGLSGEDFADQFGFDKPAIDKELVFYCLAGVRSSAAEDLARTFGYKNRGNYIGSYEDWLTNENTIKK